MAKSVISSKVADLSDIKLSLKRVRRGRFKRTPETQRKKDDFIQEMTCKGLAGGDACLKPGFSLRTTWRTASCHMSSGLPVHTVAHVHTKANV